MVTVRRKFYHVKQNLNRFRARWERLIYDRSWRSYKKKMIPKSRGRNVERKD